MASNSEYPYWKILVWRFIRAGISGGSGAVTGLFGASLVLKLDFSNGQVFFLAIVSSFVSGFISSIALAARNYFSQGNQDSLVQKIPV